MKLLIKDRGSSKTTGLIYTSESTGYPIVTNSKVQASYIKDQAKSMGCDIPEPLTVNDLQFSKLLPPKSKVLFDNIEENLEEAINYYLNADVVCATMTSTAYSTKEKFDETVDVDTTTKNENSEVE